LIDTKATPGGGMVAVELSLEEVQPILSDYPNLEVAAVNGPTAVVLSGDMTDVKKLFGKLNLKGVRNMGQIVTYLTRCE
jgi:acyl transferase domain-containing protein